MFAAPALTPLHFIESGGHGILKVYAVAWRVIRESTRDKTLPSRIWLEPLHTALVDSIGRREGQQVNSR